MIEAVASPLAFIAIGTPGSGKTSYCRQLAYELNAVHISSETVRRHLAGRGFSGDLDHHVWARYHSLVEAALLSGRHVVCDSDHAGRVERRQLVEACRSHGALRVVGYWFDAPLTLSLQRNRLQARPMDADLIKRLWWYLRSDPPSAVDGFDEVLRIVPSPAVQPQAS